MSNQALTSKQIGFAQAVVDGETLSDAYRIAYDADNMKPATINRESARLLANHRIATLIDQKRAAKALAKQVLEVSDRERSLSGIRELMGSVDAEGEPVPHAVRLNAAVWLGKSTGAFTDVVETKNGTRTAAEVQAEIERRLAELDAEVGIDDVSGDSTQH